MENLKKYLWEQHKKATISGVILAVACFVESIVNKSPESSLIVDFFMSILSGCILFAIVAYPEQAKKIGIKILNVLKVIGHAIFVFFKYVFTALAFIFKIVLKLAVIVLKLAFFVLLIPRKLPQSGSSQSGSSQSGSSQKESRDQDEFISVRQQGTFCAYRTKQGYNGTVPGHLINWNSMTITTDFNNKHTVWDVRGHQRGDMSY